MYVPAAMARAHNTMTHSGGLAPLPSRSSAIRARVMMPIVFCASLVPCASDTMEAEPIWPQRKPFSVKRSATPLVTL